MPADEYRPVWRDRDAVKRFPLVLPELLPELELLPEVSLKENS